MKKTNNLSVRESYGFFLTLKVASLKPKKELNAESINQKALLTIINYLKLLWKGYSERKQYRNEVQKRLLKQRALKREQASTPLSQTGEGHWTDRFLRLKAESFTLILRCYTSMLGSRNVFGMTNQGLEVTKLGLEMTKWSYGMTKRSFAMTAILISCASMLRAQDTIRPLKIGDSLPDITLENVQNYTDNTLILSDFKGKLVILDFWATWCAPCVKLIPKMDSLQQALKGQVQFITVAYESPAVVAKFNAQLLKRGIINNLVQVNGDQVLSLLFPHSYLPHEVWITPEGKVLTFTDESALTTTNIEKALQNQLQTKVKRDLRIPYQADSLLFINHNGSDGEAISYYKVFSKYVEGLPSRSTSWIKPNGSVVVTLLNNSLFSLYPQAFSYQRIDMLSRNRRKILVKDSSDFFAPKEKAAFHDWAVKHRYNYELRMPAGSGKKAYEEMQHDLKILFPQYTANIEKQEVDCWVLQRTSSLDKIATKGGKVIRDFNPVHFEIQNQPLRQLVGMLDIKFLSLQPFPVLDETNYKGNVDLNLDTNMTKVETINEALKAYDLALVKAKRTIELLVIRDSVK